MISIIPAAVLYKWLKKQGKNEKYEKICKKALIRGILVIFLVLLLSGTLQAVTSLAMWGHKGTLAYAAIHTFFVLAFAEELAKFLVFRSLLKNNEFQYSWFNITILMTIIGLGFGCIENSVMMVGVNLIVAVIRGLSMGHVGYGFIMGWFYGKGLKTGRRIFKVLSFLVPWLLHGLYDFGLTEELLAVNDNLAIVSVSLELVCIIMIFVIIRFVKKRRKDIKYTKALQIKN